MSQRTMEQAATCSLPLSTQPSSVKAYFDNPKNELTRFVQQYHYWVLNHVGQEQNFLYDLFPHHIFSSPWDFMQFYHLNLHDIVAYRYNLRATCFEFKDGHIVQHVLKEEHHDIPVQ